MPIDGEFLHAAQAAFNPYVVGSGTEHVAILLYSLVRMTRPRTIVEYGSGYTTLFLLRGLADNVADIEEERRNLRAKTAAFGDLDGVSISASDPRVLDWLGDGGKACGVDPTFYLEPHAPRLYSFEERGASDRYVTQMAAAAGSLRLDGLLTQLVGMVPAVDALPAGAAPIDLAWNDDKDYREFFDMFWPSLNPQGGLIGFHNTAADQGWWEDIQWMKAERARTGDLEVLTLCEPHKLNQNSCTILRRTSSHVPRFFGEDAAPRILSSAIRFMDASET